MMNEWTKEKKCANLSAAGYLKIHAHSRQLFTSCTSHLHGYSLSASYLLIKDLLSTINPQIQLHAHRHISTVHITQGSVIKRAWKHLCSPPRQGFRSWSENTDDDDDESDDQLLWGQHTDQNILDVQKREEAGERDESKEAHVL